MPCNDESLLTREDGKACGLVPEAQPTGGAAFTEEYPYGRHSFLAQTSTAFNLESHISSESVTLPPRRLKL
jgi:hypothetical protein